MEDYEIVVEAGFTRSHEAEITRQISLHDPSGDSGERGFFL